MKARERFDLVLSRAVTKLSPNLEIALPLLKVGAPFVVYKTDRFVRESEEMQAAPRALGQLGGEEAARFPYTLPNEEQSYCILVYRKARPTPSQFPRRAGMPEKKPL
jgi:16S rRNA (guanine527-N7)-methyltransferase